MPSDPGPDHRLDLKTTAAAIQQRPLLSNSSQLPRPGPALCRDAVTNFVLLMPLRPSPWPQRIAALHLELDVY